MEVVSQLTTPFMIVAMTLVLNYLMKDRARSSERLFDTKLEALRGDLGALRSDTTSQFQALRSEMTSEFQAVRSEMTAQFSSVRADMIDIALAVRADPRRQAR